MPEIEFTIDVTSGDLTIQVKGVAGPACQDVAKLAKELLGVPTSEQNTPEYSSRGRIASHVTSAMRWKACSGRPGRSPVPRRPKFGFLSRPRQMR